MSFVTPYSKAGSRLNSPVGNKRTMFSKWSSDKQNSKLFKENTSRTGHTTIGRMSSKELGHYYS